MRSAESVIVLHQARAHEWRGTDNWAFRSTRKLVSQGFVVVRVDTPNWWNLKATHPSLFKENLFLEKQNCQQIICTLIMTELTIPLAGKLRELLREEAYNLTKDTVTRWQREFGLVIYLPSGREVRVNEDVMCVTESSSLVADNFSPTDLLNIFHFYPTPVVWVGFNQAEQRTGSKALVASHKGLNLLAEMLTRLLKHHLDQTYKALTGCCLLQMCQRNHICFGVMPHRLGCNSGNADWDEAMSEHQFLPTPELTSEASPFSYEDHLDALTITDLIHIGLRNSALVKGHSDVEDLVGLRLWSYLTDYDPLRYDPEACKVQYGLQAVADEKALRRGFRQLVFAFENPDVEQMVCDVDENKETAADMSETLNYIAARGWMNEKLGSGEVLSTYHYEALVRRGLKKHPTEDCLICTHDDTPLWTGRLAWEHFMTEDNSHVCERRLMREEVDQEDSFQDAHEESVLQQYFGREHLLHRMGGILECLRHMGLFGMKESRGGSEMALCSIGYKCPSECPSGDLQLHHVVEYIITLGEIAWFADDTAEDKNIQGTRRIDKCKNMPNKILDCSGFPSILKDGMARAQNESYWTRALWDAQQAVACENWEVLRCAVGQLFKSLEVTLNKSADMHSELAAVICSNIMMGVAHRGLGTMSFTMSFDASSGGFSSHVRYRPQGRDAARRYLKATAQQRISLLMDRPLFAAVRSAPSYTKCSSTEGKSKAKKRRRG